MNYRICIYVYVYKNGEHEKDERRNEANGRRGEARWGSVMRAREGASIACIGMMHATWNKK
jgi:hypothetical protein